MPLSDANKSDANKVMTEARPISAEEIAGLLAGFERQPLALAVSGGADSMALMQMVARWARAPKVQAIWRDQWHHHALSLRPDCQRASHVARVGTAKPTWLRGVETPEDVQSADAMPHVVVLTVDHGLRAASRREAAFVAEVAATLGLPCMTLRWDGEKPATGIQEAARNVRRDLMCEVLRAEADLIHDFTIANGSARVADFGRSIVTAHHQEDQAETFLMRLARGSGLEGLGGMRERGEITCRETRERPQAFQVGILRPLLDIPKARLVATLQSYGGVWVEDPSNEDQRFERVRVRQMMPLLAEIGLSADKIALSARRLKGAELDLHRAMNDAAFVSLRPTFSHGGLMSEFEIGSDNPFLSSTYVLIRSLRQLLRAYGGSARDVELAQLEQLLSMLRNEGRPSGVTLAGCKIEFQGEQGMRLRVYREGSGEGLPVVPIEPGQSVGWDGQRFTVHAREDAPADAAVCAMRLQGWADLKKAVPCLGGLKWPAAAAATLPVIAIGGAIVAYPGITSVLESGDGVAGSIRGEMAAFAGESAFKFTAEFGQKPW